MSKTNMIHIYGASSTAPDGYIWSLPREGELEWEDILPVLRPVSDRRRFIRCMDCEEPAIIISGGFGWQPATNTYCQNCANVHLNIEWKPEDTQ